MPKSRMKAGEYNLLTPEEKAQRRLSGKRAWANNNRQKCRDSVTSWRRRNPVQNSLIIQKGNLSHRYGLSLEQYNKILQDQKGVCAICGQRESRNLSVDHNHRTNKNRGLLCSACNWGLGLIESKNPDALNNLIAYIQRFEVVNEL